MLWASFQGRVWRPLSKINTLVAIFYVDNGLIASCNPKTLYTAVDLLAGLFDCVGLQTNSTKTEVMTFVPGKIWTSLLDTAARMEEDFRSKGKGRKVKCGNCDKMLVVGLLAGHLAKQHDIYLPVGRDGGGPIRLAASIAPAVGGTILHQFIFSANEN